MTHNKPSSIGIADLDPSFPAPAMSEQVKQELLPCPWEAQSSGHLDYMGHYVKHTDERGNVTYITKCVLNGEYAAHIVHCVNTHAALRASRDQLVYMLGKTKRWIEARHGNGTAEDLCNEIEQTISDAEPLT